MKWDKSCTKEQILEASVKVINSVPEPGIRADLIAAIRREVVLQSALFKEWAKDFKEEGKMEGKIEGKIEGEITNKLHVVLICIADKTDIKFIKKLSGFSSVLIEKLSKAKGLSDAYDIYMHDLFLKASVMLNNSKTLESVQKKTKLAISVLEEIALATDIPDKGDVFKSWKIRAWTQEMPSSTITRQVP
jgi:hypothetical protein